MKKILAFLFCLITLLGVMAGCSQQQTNEGNNTPAGGVTAPEKDVEMQYISAADAANVLGTDGYTFLDVRKAEDYAAGHIPGAVSTDMDAAKNGDFNAGVATMQTATKNLDDTLVIICYSGKAYAQATTNVLSAIGYDMSKVFTLEGGFNGWSETYPDKVEAAAAEIVAPKKDVKMQYMTAADAANVLGTDGYTFLDVRKAEDYAAGHIPGVVSTDMDAAKNGDFDAGVATMQAATKDLTDTLVIICYSGKAYAQATTNVLSAIGYDMSKVFTLEGGFNGWSETYPDKVETAATGTTVSGTVTTSIDMTQYEEGKVVRVWLPVAQTDDYQTVSNVKYDANNAKTELTKDALGNQMLYIEWGADADPASRTASVSFHAIRPEFLRPELIEKGAPGSELNEYLQPSSTIPLDGEVKALADEITKDQTTYLGKARAIYDWIIANMERDNSVIGCGQGNVPELLNTLRGKCTDINSVFVGLCRAAGIPARETFGIRMNADDITGNQHCWAQFYLPGTGWVFADPADVLKAVLTNGWDKEDAETKEQQEYYWGGVDAKRVGLSNGRDIVLNPAQEGAALNNFGYPYAEVDGQVMDCYEPADFVYSITFVAD